MQDDSLEAFSRLLSGVWLAWLHSLWLGLAAAAVAALVVERGARLSHRARHLILAAALMLTAVGPPAMVLLSISGVRSSASALVISDRESEGSTAGVASMRWDQATAQPSPLPFETASLSSWARRAVKAASEATARAMRGGRSLILSVWGVTTWILAVGLVLGTQRLRRLREEAFPAPPVVHARARRLARLLRLRSLPEVRVHPRTAEPCLFGVRRPVVLLPGRWLESAGPALIDAVLAHELAHARRFDQVANLMQRCLETLLFFHPGVHWLSRALRREAEFCADALAVRVTGDPWTLACALESVARFQQEPSRPCPGGVTLGGDGSLLLPRVQELLGMTPIESPRSRLWPWLALPCALAAAWMSTAVGFALDEPPRSALHETPRPAGSLDSSRGPTPLGADQDRDRNDDPDRELSYEVRVIDRVSSSWPELVSGLPKVRDKKSGDSGWTLDVSDLKALLLRVQADPSSTVLQAPRVIVSEGEQGFVATPPSALPVAAADKSRSVTVTGTPGEGRTPTQGTTVRFSGDRLKQGTRITIEVSESWPAPAADSPQSGGPSRQVRLDAIELPMGHSLAVDLGRKRRDVGAVSLLCDRLVVIRPRRVANDPDSLPTVSPSTRISRNVGATP